MKRPNEAKVLIEYTEGIGSERTLVFTGKRADSLQMLAVLASHPSRFHGFTNEPRRMADHLNGAAEALADEFAKPLPFVDVARVAELCLDLAARCVLYVEDVCWQPEKWRNP
jgi:hypothetical protein